ncbi:MAG: YkvA family protein [Myxococcaceae bacterium]
MAFEKTRMLHKLWRYLRDGRVPLWRKLVGVAAVAYLVWPFDLIPDFIPILGWLDDAGVLTAAAVFLVRDVRLHEARYPELPSAAPAPETVDG